ncbi:hypothetical protein EVJ58_g4162 [Rhodofomes roseus]|uniref:DUF2470 domain-containing protein n=1 Tax=Rhodofomes roseus TaxID=34475 RepID=A0A4Y9YHF8_9APHY|nr:hypothetical protein EVJ58_g4162 [Rhodofomes roseus]
MADPVASKSGFLCMYMSNHPDTLVGYVKHWGKVAEDVSSAKMTSIDTKGMTLAYKTKAGGPEKEVRVLFDPPLLGYEEVKPRLISMKVDAEEALGMARAPQITTFRLPFGIWTTNVLLAFLLYVTFSPEPQSPNFAPAYLPAHYARTNLPVWAVPASWWIVVIVHPLEALYALYMARRHRMPFTTGVGYVLGTLIWGLPVLNELRHQRQAARIESGIARALEIERQLNAGEGRYVAFSPSNVAQVVPNVSLDRCNRTVEELIKSDDPLKGVEAARLRRWFSSSKMIPLRDLTDDFGSAVLFGRLEVVQADILARMHKHAQRSTPDPRAAVVRDIYEMRWGPTQVPIFNLILLSTLLVPAMRPQQLAVARFLINEMKMPVDGRDVSGATGALPRDLDQARVRPPSTRRSSSTRAAT